MGTKILPALLCFYEFSELKPNQNTNKPNPNPNQTNQPPTKKTNTKI